MIGNDAGLCAWLTVTKLTNASGQRDGQLIPVLAADAPRARGRIVARYRGGSDYYGAVSVLPDDGDRGPFRLGGEVGLARSPAKASGMRIMETGGAFVHFVG